jgi:hypothetical protein
MRRYVESCEIGESWDVKESGRTNLDLAKDMFIHRGFVSCTMVSVQERLIPMTVALERTLPKEDGVGLREGKS